MEKRRYRRRSLIPAIDLIISFILFSLCLTALINTNPYSLITNEIQVKENWRTNIENIAGNYSGNYLDKKNNINYQTEAIITKDSNNCQISMDIHAYEGEVIPNQEESLMIQSNLTLDKHLCSIQDDNGTSFTADFEQQSLYAETDLWSVSLQKNENLSIDQTESTYFLSNIPFEKNRGMYIYQENSPNYFTDANDNVFYNGYVIDKSLQYSLDGAYGIQYLLQNNYSTLQFKTQLLNKYCTTGTLQVYGEDNLIYQCTIDSSISGKVHQVEIAGVNQLSILIVSDYSGIFGVSDIALVDVEVLP